MRPYDVMAMEKIVININLSSAVVKTSCDGKTMTFEIIKTSDDFHFDITNVVDQPVVDVKPSEKVELVEKVKTVPRDHRSLDDIPCEEEECEAGVNEEVVNDIQLFINKIEREMMRDSYSNYFKNERMKVHEENWNAEVTKMEKYINERKDSSVLVSDIEKFMEEIDEFMTVDMMSKQIQKGNYKKTVMEWNLAVSVMEAQINKNKIKVEDVKPSVVRRQKSLGDIPCETDDEEDKDMERDIEYGYLARECAACETDDEEWLDESELGFGDCGGGFKSIEDQLFDLMEKEEEQELLMTKHEQRPKKIKCKDIPIVPLPPMEYYKMTAEEEQSYFWLM